ncbi:hypothetical protein BD408DRAFT_440013 [Parasitella parasitica]|nr:hypothetical protein BD408DRAFT_440013 [Parasitella parasitica]
MVKPRSYKKTLNKKKQSISTIHPYIELIQGEINILASEIETIDKIQKERELTSTEQAQKDIVTACLEKYQATLTKLNDSPMQSKLRSYNDITISKKNETQTLFILQFFYIVRLGQLGLFDLIEIESPKSMLDAITDICDQLIGASVYHATDPSPSTKSQKRKQVFDILKKLETNSEDIILGNITFKDIKNLIQHVWDNTLNEEQILEDGVIDESAAKGWAVIQFENMVQNEGVQDGNINDDAEGSQKNHNKEEVEPLEEEEIKKEEEATAIQPQQQQADELPDHESPVENEHLVKTQPAVDSDPPAENETSTSDEWNKKDINETSVKSKWDKKDSSKAPAVRKWDKKETGEISVANKWANTTDNRRSSKSTTRSNWKTNSKSYSENAAETWDAKENRGWDVIDNTVKGDAWDNAASNSDKNDKNWTNTSSPNDTNWTLPQPLGTADVQQVNTPPASPKFVDNLQQESSEPAYNAETSDNWRRRGIEDINNSRGRGPSYRGSFRGNRGGKFRGGSGAGGPGRGRGGGNGSRMNNRGRGRGRGRGADLDSEHHSNAS